MEKDNGRGTFNTLLNFLMKLENYYIIFTSPNADSNTSHFKKKINYFIKKKKIVAILGALVKTIIILF